jgi:hypothetical protein
MCGKGYNFCDIMPCFVLKGPLIASCFLLGAGFLLCLLFDPEYEVDMLFRNVG